MIGPSSTRRPQPGDLMAEAFLLSAARTPIGKFLGGLADVSAPELGAIALKAALERAKVAARQGRRSHLRQRATSRARSEPGPAGGPQGRAAGHDRGVHRQQGLRLRPQGGHAGRPGDPGRRRRPDRGRRHGVDEPGAAPALRCPGRLEVRRPKGRRFGRFTTASGARSRTGRWARRPSTSPPSAASPGETWTRSPSKAISGPRRRGKRRRSTTKSCR